MSMEAKGWLNSCRSKIFRGAVWAAMVVAAPAAWGAGAGGPPLWAPVGQYGYGSELVVLAADTRMPSTVYATASGELLRSSDGGNTWVATGGKPGLQSVSNMAIDPDSPDTLYVLTYDGSMWRSDDAGAHFIQVWEPATTAIAESVATGPGIVLHSRNFDLYKSTDRGATWTLIFPSLVNDPHVNTADPNKLYFSLTYPAGGGLMQSSDGGATWARTGPVVSGEPFPAGGWVRLTLVPSEPSTLLANAGNLYRSLDNGASWVEISPYGGFDAITVDPLSSQRMYGLTGLFFLGQPYFSSDGGFTWGPVKDLPPARGFSDGSSNLLGLVWVNGTHRAIAGSNFSGAVHLHEYAATWLQGGPHSLPNGPIHFLKFSPLDPKTFLAGTAIGLSGSSDHGATWFTLPANLLPELDDLEFDSASRLTFFAAAGSHRHGVLRSDDGGQTWVTVASAFALREATTVLRRGEALLAGGAGIHLSSDGGHSWTEVLSQIEPEDPHPTRPRGEPPRRVVRRLIADPADEQVAYAVVETEIAVSAGSAEAAQDAQHAQDAPGAHDAEIVQLTQPTDTAQAKPGRRARAASGSPILRLYRTRDGGQTWQAVADGFSALAIDFRHTPRLYAGDPAGAVQVSEDGGGTWRPLGTVGAPINDLLVDAYVPTTLLAATTGGGVMRSTDRGLTWQPVNDGLTERGRLTIGRLVADFAVPLGFPHLIFALPLPATDQELGQPGLFSALFPGR